MIGRIGHVFMHDCVRCKNTASKKNDNSQWHGVCDTESNRFEQKSAK